MISLKKIYEMCTEKNLFFFLIDSFVRNVESKTIEGLKFILTKRGYLSKNGPNNQGRTLTK